MDFEDAKENIQPLATGRNASILQASISHSPQELLEQRRELEASIHSYNGTDPLEPWYAYIQWIEQSFPSGGKESGLMQVLSKCLRRFESEERYYQDRRMIKLFIKLLDSHKDSTECYQQLYNAGIGTMVADFYIAWAYCCDAVGQTRKADEVFRRGLDCRAEPLEELKEAYHHFGFSVGQRTLYKDDKDAIEAMNLQLEERRSALSSLRKYRGRSGKSEIGSIRTGSAIKSLKPGTIKNENNRESSTSSNARVAVLSDENANPNMESEVEELKSQETEQPSEILSANVVRSIVDKTRHQENEKEPGPWNKVHDKNNTKKLLRQKKVVHELGFSIHEDEAEENEIAFNFDNTFKPIILPESERYFDKPFKYPTNFVSRNRSQPEWILPITTECQPDPKTLPQYNKCMVYPRPNREFQIEELRGYLHFKKRNIQNSFTQRYSTVWGNDITVPIRLYPNFARESKPQPPDELDTFFFPPKEDDSGVLMAPVDRLYNVEKKEEFQIEELKRFTIRRTINDTVIETEDMDETMCASSNNEQVQRRKSFFPSRRSLAIRSVITAKSENTKEDIKEPKTKLAQIVEKPCTSHSVAVSDEEAHTENSKNSKCLPRIFELEDSEKVATTTTKTTTEQALEFPTTSSKTIANDFQFKTPALPIQQAKAIPEAHEQSIEQTVKKLPFEIYIEENISSVNPGILNDEDTCSTQIFNNLIKSQPASTPKCIQKVPRRQFGVLLDAQPSTSTIPLSSTPATQTTIGSSPSAISTDSNERTPSPFSNSPISPDVQNEMPTNSFSPLPRKQLSTILETSENGTTQGAHSTGTSTKSTNGSQESDFDAALNIGTNTLAGNATAVHTTKSLSTMGETSSMKEVVELIRNTHLSTAIPESLEHSTGHGQQSNTSAKTISPPIGSDKFVIYVDDTETWPQLPKASISHAVAGNFDRMVERENTATNCFAVQSSIRFQDDKTETITKLPGTYVFPIDRTETIPKFHETIFSEEQQASTLSLQKESNWSTTPSCAPTLQTVITGNTSKKVLTDVIVPKQFIDNKHLEDNNDYDSFDFFQKTPPKPLKTASKMDLHHLRIESKPTPLNIMNAKRHCLQESPIQFSSTKENTDKPNPQMEMMKFFENEMMNVDDDQSIAVEYFPKGSFANNLARNASFKANKMENNLENSFFPNVSLTGQQTSLKTKDEGVRSAKALFQISHADQTCSKLTNSISQERSFIAETQPLELNKKTTQDSSLQTYKMFNYSFAKETQTPQTEASFKPPENMYESNKNIQNKTKDQLQITSEKSILKFSSLSNTQNKLPGSLQRNFSYIDETQAIAETSTKSQHENSSSEISVKEQRPQLRGSYIPKRISTKKHLESELPSQSVMLKQTQSGSADSIMAENKSFIPETQETQSKSIHLSQNRPTTSNNFFQKSILSNSKNNDRSLEFSEIDKESTEEYLRTSTIFGSKTSKSMEKSQENYANHSFSNSNVVPIFELNAESEMFSTGISMIKNSTMLPRSLQAQTHSKQIIEGHNKENHEHKQDRAALEVPYNTSQSKCDENMSIYYKHTPRTPLLKLHNESWSDNEEIASEGGFVHPDIDLNETAQQVKIFREDENVNPFNADLLNALLDEIDFVHYLNNLENTMLVGRVPRLNPKTVFKIKEMEFKVTKLIGEGAYGTIYRGVEKKSGKEYALKQERPPNYWEYYICLEVQNRITKEEILPAYMNIDYALIGNNASIFASSFSSYGSIITMCNKIKKCTQKNVDEYVVMHLTCELLEIVDHLHASLIIHADLKADNFLLMKKLEYNSIQPSLQLIDFGVSIDMKRFKRSQTFTYAYNDNTLKCVEMRENRPWSYQLDLYGLAGIIHVMLFGKYMDIEKHPDKGIWMPKSHFPRYLHRLLWESIFRALLNVRDCESMPNLQELRSFIKQEMAEKERFVVNKISEFNKALDA